MTPQNKRRTTWGAIATIAIGACTALASKVVPASAAAVDRRYVHVEAFTAYRAAQHEKAKVDSVSRAADMRELMAWLQRVDNTTQQIRLCQRHPSRCD